MTHNNKKSSYKMNINEFTTMSDKEFRKKYLEDKIEREQYNDSGRKLKEIDVFKILSQLE